MADSNEERLKEEVAKLGPNAAARIVAVQDFIAAQVGHDRAGAMAANLTTAAQIEAWEKILSNARTQQRAAEVASASAPAPSQPPRESNGPVRVDEATFAKMSARERIDYARQFPQPNDGGAGR
jgi:hypothetical protein